MPVTESKRVRVETKTVRSWDFEPEQLETLLRQHLGLPAEGTSVTFDADYFRGVGVTHTVVEVEQG